jgi:VCBS repeat-containing protein
MCNAAEGQTLIATPTASSDEAVTVSYQWQSSGDGGATWNPIAGATGATYVLQEGDESDLVRVQASATDDTGQLVTATSNATSAVADAPLVITIGPSDSASGSVAENPAVVTLVTGGTLSFSGLDTTEKHTASATAQAGDFGTLTAVVSQDTIGTGTGGVLTWNYQVSEAKVQTLSANQTKTDTFTVSVADGDGGTATQTVTVVINASPNVVQWINASSNTWNTPGNWTPVSVPGAQNIALITLPVTVSYMTGTDTVAALTETAGSFAQSGGALTVSGTSTFNNLSESGGTLTLNGATSAVSLTEMQGELNGSGTLTVAGKSTFSLSYSTTQGGTGTTIAQGGATFNGSSYTFGLDGGRTLELGGSSSVTASLSIDLNGTDPITQTSDPGSGTLTILAGATLSDLTTGGLNIFAANRSNDTGKTAAVNNQGTFIKGSPGGSTATSTISTLFNNTGVVDVESGTLVLSGGGTDTGATYEGPGTVDFLGGTRTVEASSTITANITFSGGTTTINCNVGTGLIAMTGSSLGGTATFNGTVTTAALNETDGELNGSGTLTVTGGATFALSYYATQSGPGTTIAQGGATFSGGTVYPFGLDSGRTLELDGTSSVTGNYFIVDLNGANPDNNFLSDPGSGTLTILSGATFDDLTTGNGNLGLQINATNRGVGDDGSTATFNNQGTFVKGSAGGSIATSIIATQFNNSGTVNVQSGTLKITSSVNNTGGLLKADGGTLVVAGSSGGNAEINGSSTIQFTAPSTTDVTFDAGSTGTLEVSGSVGYGGTVSGLALGNYVDLADVQYFGSTTPAPEYVANADNTGGTLWVVTNDTSKGITYGEVLFLSGTYGPNSFVESSDGHGGALITDPPVTASAGNNSSIALLGQYVASQFPSSVGCQSGPLMSDVGQPPTVLVPPHA